MTDSSRSLFGDFTADAPYVTEARRLLQALLRRHRSPASRVYMVTSAGRGEGKSTICGLLAITAARIFHRHTLVIDSDLRRPTMHHLLEVADRPGLYELFQGTTTTDKAIRPTTIPLLHALPSGRPAAHVSESYDDEAFQKLLASLRPSYDLIFIDAAPVVPVVEPIMMAEHVDGILLVAMAGRTPITMIRRMRGIIAPVANKVAGAIVNNAAEGLPYYYDYSYYGYNSPARRGRSSRKAKAAGADPGTEPSAGKPTSPANGAAKSPEPPKEPR